MAAEFREVKRDGVISSQGNYEAFLYFIFHIPYSISHIT
jgi:hypothetical protein